MIIEKKREYIYTVILAIVFIIAFIVIQKLLTISFIYADDTDTALALTFREVFRHPANGIFTAGIPDNLFGCYLPLKLNIHPSAFKSAYFSIIETLIILFFAFLSYRFITKKTDYFSPVAFVFTISLMFYFITEQPYMLFVYDGFFRMLFASFWWILFFISFINFTKSKNIKNTLLLSLYVFINTISGELNCILMSVSMPLYTLYSILKKDKNAKISILFILSIILGVFTLYKTGTFVRKSMYFIDINQFLPEIKDFIKVYINYAIIKHLSGYLLIIGFILFTKKRFNNEYTKKLSAISVFTIIGILLFFSSLIALGKTHMGDNTYWLVHADIHVMVNIILYSMIFAFLNICTNNQKITKYVVTILLLISSIFLLKYNFDFYSNFKKNLLKEKKDIYIIEKIIRTAMYNNKTAYINNEKYDGGIYWFLMPYTDEVKSGTLYKESPYINYLNNVDKNFNFQTGFIFTNEKIEKEEFLKNGGKLSNEELDILDFEALRKINSTTTKL